MAAYEHLSPAQLLAHLDEAVGRFGGVYKGDHVEFPSGEEGGRPLRLAASDITFEHETGSGKTFISMGLSGEGPLGDITFSTFPARGSDREWAFGHLGIDHGHLGDGDEPVIDHAIESGTRVTAESLREVIDKSRRAIEFHRARGNPPDVYSEHLKDPKDPSKGMRGRPQLGYGVVKHGTEDPDGSFTTVKYQYNRKTGQFDPMQEESE